MRILILFIACSALVAVVTVILFRTFIRLIGLKDVMNEGVVLTDDGVEYCSFLFTGKRTLPYREIRSAELLSYSRVVLSALVFAYGISANKVPFRPFHKI